MKSCSVARIWDSSCSSSLLSRRLTFRTEPSSSVAGASWTRLRLRCCSRGLGVFVVRLLIIGSLSWSALLHAHGESLVDTWGETPWACVHRTRIGQSDQNPTLNWPELLSRPHA